MATSCQRYIALVSGLGWHVQDLDRAARRLGIILDPIRFESLVGHVGISGKFLESATRAIRESDGVLIRMMPPGSLERVIYRMDALHRLEKCGHRLMNSPRAVEVSVDKYLSLGLMADAGLPVPPTIVAESADDALDAFDRLGGDVVVKPLFGSEGRGLIRVSDRELARRAFSTLERIHAVIYVQKTIRHPGFDFRVFVLGGEVLGVIRRSAPEGEWRTNVAIGGRPEACKADPTIERLAVDAASAVGAEMAGVDLLDDLDGGRPVLLEVNAVPGWKAFASVTGIDVACAILKRLRGR